MGRTAIEGVLQFEKLFRADSSRLRGSSIDCFGLCINHLVTVPLFKINIVWLSSPATIVRKARATHGTLRETPFLAPENDGLSTAGNSGGTLSRGIPCGGSY